MEEFCCNALHYSQGFVPRLSFNSYFFLNSGKIKRNNVWEQMRWHFAAWLFSLFITDVGKLKFQNALLQKSIPNSFQLPWPIKSFKSNVKINSSVSKIQKDKGLCFWWGLILSLLNKFEFFRIYMKAKAYKLVKKELWTRSKKHDKRMLGYAATKCLFITLETAVKYIFKRFIKTIWSFPIGWGKIAKCTF